MRISLPMWHNLTNLADGYSAQGFADYPQPWFASQRAIEMTLPPGTTPTVLHGEDLLVGSAEQAFIDRMLQGTMKPGKWQTITPCFRREPQYDALHLPYFVKLELIHYMPEQVEYALSDMLAVVHSALQRRLNCHPLAHELRLTRERTDIGWDLMLRGQEVGSYGIRAFENHQWVYGTGVAEPRFSTLMSGRCTDPGAAAGPNP